MGSSQWQGSGTGGNGSDTERHQGLLQHVDVPPIEFVLFGLPRIREASGPASSRPGGGADAPTMEQRVDHSRITLLRVPSTSRETAVGTSTCD